jgi:hypothetical protein
LEKTIDTLKRDIHQLQPDHDLLKKATELLKKGLGLNLRLQSNRDKALLGDALKASYLPSELFAGLTFPGVRTSIIVPVCVDLTNTPTLVAAWLTCSSEIIAATGIGECARRCAKRT